MRRLLAAWVVCWALPASAQTVLVTSLVVEDVAFHAASGRLYATLPAGMGGAGTAVAEIDPSTGAILTRVAIADGPGGGARQVALTDDGATLYVGVDGGRSIRRYAVPAFTPGPEFPLGTGPFGQPYLVRDMTVVPGTTSTLVVGRYGGGAPELVVLDDGVPRPATAYGETAIFYGAARMVEPTVFGNRYRLEASGIVADDPPRTIAGGLASAAGGLGYDQSGGVVDLGGEQLLGTCDTYGMPVPALDRDTVFYFRYDRIVTCAPSSFLVTGERQLPGFASGVRTALRTGPSQVTLVDTLGRVLVAAGLDAALPPRPAQTGPEWRPIVDISATVRLTGCVRCRAGDLLVAQGVIDRALVPVEVKAAVILPNAMAVPATVLGESHLELRGLYGPVGGTILQVVLPPGLPPGAWQVELSLLDPVSGAVLSRGSAPFEVLP